MLSRRAFLGGCLGVGVAAGSAGWYSGIYEPANIEIVRRTVKMPGFPSRLAGLTAVQVSDLHLVHAGNVFLRLQRDSPPRLKQSGTLRPLLFVSGRRISPCGSTGAPSQVPL